MDDKRSKADQLFDNYLAAAGNLAESVRSDVQHNNRVVSNFTVSKLNDFIIALNSIEDFNKELTDEENEDNVNLN